MGHDLPGGEGVLDLLDNDRREDRLDVQSDIISDLRAECQQALVLQLGLTLHLAVGLVTERAVVDIALGLRHGKDGVVALVRNQTRAFLALAVDAESGIEQVQQTAVVAVTTVFRIELPVAGHELSRIAQNLDRALEDALNVFAHHWTQKVVERGDGRVEGAEHEAAECLDPQPLQRMLGHIEFLRIAAHAFQPPPERHADKRTGRVVGPLVIDADERPVGLVTTQRAAHGCALVGAAIYPGMDGAIGCPRHHHRSIADMGRTEIAAVGQLGFEAEVAPGLSAKDVFLFGSEDRLAVIDCVIDRSRLRPRGDGHGFGVHGLLPKLVRNRGPKRVVRKCPSRSASSRHRPCRYRRCRRRCHGPPTCAGTAAP